MVEGHPESLAALDEAANAFREGHFISVILLALAAVEHELVEALVDRSLATYSVKAKDATDRARQHQVLDVALLERVTQLRLVRNPFVHLKPPDHAHGYAHRYIAGRASQEIARGRRAGSLPGDVPRLPRAAQTDA